MDVRVSPRGQIIEVDGRRVHLRHTPADCLPANRAIYVHGHNGSSLIWTDLAALLSRQVDGVAVDLPGFGRSEPADDYSVDATAAALAAVVEATCGEPVHLMGNSFGGTVSLHLAALRPDLVRSLTLISPAVPFLNPRWSRYASPRLARQAFAGEAALRRELAGMDPEQLVTDSLARCCEDTTAIAPARIQEVVEEARQALASPWRLSAEARSFRALVWTLLRAYLPGRGSLLRLARQVKVPTLVLWGDRDRILDVRMSSRLIKLLPNAKLGILRGLGHLPHVEAPARVADAIAPFLTAQYALVNK